MSARVISVAFTPGDFVKIEGVERRAIIWQINVSDKGTVYNAAWMDEQGHRAEGWFLGIELSPWKETIA